MSTDNYVPLLCVTSNVIITYHCCAAETRRYYVIRDAIVI